MQHERDKQRDERRIAEICIALLDHCHQTELRDGERDKGEDKSEHGVARQMSLHSLCIVFAAALNSIDAARNNAGDHVDRSRNRTETDYDGEASHAI